MRSSGAAGSLWGLCLLLLVPDWGSGGFPLAVFLAAAISAVGLASNVGVFRV